MAKEFKFSAKFKKELFDNNKKALVSSGEILQDAIKKELSGSSPSAPGSPPGQVSGDLKNSINIDITNLNKNIVTIGSDLPYAAVQEWGGMTNNAVLPPRPYLRHALAKNIKKIVKEFEKKQ